MLILIVSPIVLCILLYAIARHNAEFNILTTFFVSVGIGIGCLIANQVAGESLILVLLLDLVVAGLLIWKFCYTTILQTVIVTTAFVAYLVFAPLLLGVLL